VKHANRPIACELQQSIGGTLLIAQSVGRSLLIPNHTLECKQHAAARDHNEALMCGSS
jgi:hypothetical protein